MAEPVSFIDGKGVQWTVREEGVDDAVVVPPGRDKPLSWLTFETDLEIRRLWSYPDDWRRFPDWQLESLCRRAHTVVARFPHSRYAARRRDEDGRDSNAP